jgi:cell division protein FtsN
MKSNPLQAFTSQRGGTLLGFILGLLVGLAGALSVAIYVTRVPVPFVDRGVSRKPAQDEQEAERNRGWNPNAALGSRDAAGAPPAPPPPAADEGGTIVVPPADGRELPAPTPSAAPEAPVARPVAPAPGDPLGDLARSRLGQSAATAAPPPAAAAGPGADPFTYFVQAGAYRTPEDAETQRARLAMLGITAEVSEREQSGRTVFRVRAGPFNQKALADATREQLETSGIEAALVRVQR